MSGLMRINDAYKDWLKEVRNRFKQSQINAVVKVDEDIQYYFELYGSPWLVDSQNRLIVCKYKDNVEAQYVLKATNQPIGVSEYELSKLIPEDFNGLFPTIEEIEAELVEVTGK